MTKVQGSASQVEMPARLISPFSWHSFITMFAYQYKEGKYHD